MTADNALNLPVDTPVRFTHTGTPMKGRVVTCDPDRVVAGQVGAVKVRTERFEVWVPSSRVTPLAA
jgi:hypothetical protein